MKFQKNKSGSFWLTVFALNFSGQLCRHRTPFAKLTWGTGDGAQLGFSIACFYALWFHWDVPWRLAKRVSFLRGERRDFGFQWNSGLFYFDFGREQMGSYWGRRDGRFGGLKAIWLNKQISLWRNTWVLGRDRVTRVTLGEQDVVINAGRWPGDSYPAVQTIERMSWRNRFRTIEKTSIWWSLPSGRHGIPTSTRGKWGDRYDETFGFGATDDGSGIDNILAARLKLLLKDWPEGLVAEYQEVPV